MTQPARLCALLHASSDAERGLVEATRGPLEASIEPTTFQYGLGRALVGYLTFTLCRLIEEGVRIVARRVTTLAVAA